MLRHLTALFPVAALMAISFAGRADDTSRVGEAAALFDTYCLTKWVDFADIDRRATEAHLEVAMERSIPLQNGQAMRQKNRVVASRNGQPTMLTSNDVTNGPLHVVGCGIYSPDLDGVAMEEALSSLARLRTRIKHTQGDGGSQVTWWTAHVGKRPASDDSQVMLSRDVPGMPGVSVNLILKTHLNTAEAK